MRQPWLALSLLVLSLSTASADLPTWVPGQVCCVLKPGADIDEVNARWGTITVDGVPSENLYLLYVASVEDLRTFADELTGDPSVLLAEPNYCWQTPEAVRQMVVGAIGGTWDDFEYQEMAAKIGIATAHQITQGQGVTVAVLDTGLDPTHEAFAGRLSDYGYDAVNDDYGPWEEANGFDDDFDSVIDEGYGHGTMVAGLIALVAPAVEIMPIRVLDDEGSGTLFSVARGLIFASAHDAQLVNMSFGSPTVSELIAHYLDLLNARSTLCLAGAGNRNLETPPYFPACDNHVLMITAVDTMDVKADFADFTPHVRLSAPGVGIRSAYPEDEWAIGYGCSFATPLATGGAALVLSQCPGMAPGQIIDALLAAVLPIDDIPGNEMYRWKLGTGRIFLPMLFGIPVSGVEQEVASRLELQAFPNPTRGTVFFRMSETALDLSIYDATGRRIRALRSPMWNGRDDAGRRVSPGIYWVRGRGRAGVQDAPILMLK